MPDDPLAAEEWLEAPAPFLRYLVSTHGGCYDVTTDHFLQATETQAKNDGHKGGSPAYRLSRTPRPEQPRGGRHYVPIGALVWRTYYGPVGPGWVVERVEPELGWRVGNLRKVNAITRWREGNR